VRVLGAQAQARPRGESERRRIHRPTPTRAHQLHGMALNGKLNAALLTSYINARHTAPAPLGNGQCKNGFGLRGPGPGGTNATPPPQPNPIAR
jgi:hypothetical protein